MTILTIGVLCVQGAVSEHVSTLKRTFSSIGIKGRGIPIRYPKDLHNIDGIIIPGGESTTISHILTQTGIYQSLQRLIEDNAIAIMGTCAGCVLLASELDQKSNLKVIPLLNAMSMQVKRNAFGRQQESFEHAVSIKGFSVPYPAVFIRAPIITKCWDTCKIMGSFENKIVAAQQNRFLALSFHPELTNDIRMHQHFLEII